MFTLTLTPCGTCCRVTKRGAQGWVEVRGASVWAACWADDTLSQFLNRLDPMTVSQLMADDPATPWAGNPRTAPTLAACRALFAANP